MTKKPIDLTPCLVLRLKREHAITLADGRIVREFKSGAGVKASWQPHPHYPTCLLLQIEVAAVDRNGTFLTTDRQIEDAVGPQLVLDEHVIPVEHIAQHSRLRMRADISKPKLLGVEPNLGPNGKTH